MDFLYNALSRAKERIEGIVKVVALVAVLAGTTTAQFRDGVQFVTGIDIIITEISGIKKDIADLDTAVATLRGDFEVAIFDDNQSFVHDNCHIGEICTATIAAQRTTFGALCGAPYLSPKVRNHGGRKLAAEGITKGVKIGSGEWHIMEVQFVAPMSAYPGRGTFWLELEYSCPSGTEFSKSSQLPFPLLAPLKDQ